MASELEVSVTAPFAVGDIVAQVCLTDGRQPLVVLRGGYFRGTFSSRPTSIKLTTDPAPQGEAPLSFPSISSAGDAQGIGVDVNTLFETGCEVPESGRLILHVVWGAHCHSDRLPDAPEGKRFASWEHVICARFVGLQTATGGASKLVFSSRVASFTEDTLLPVGKHKLRFGEIICLAGDYYAHLDDTAVREFAWAWPALDGLWGWVAGDYRAQTLMDDCQEQIASLLSIIRRDKDENRGAAGEYAALAFDTLQAHYPARRYLALASQNYCHFACPRPGGGDTNNEALRLYRAYHTRALDEARAANEAADRDTALLRALATDAFGCHFLTDLFASGHMRVPRRILGERFGVFLGALKMSQEMHQEDNKRGLWCTTRYNQGAQRVVWQAFGDGMLREETVAQHLRQVQEAVRRSAAEVFAAHCGVELDDAGRAEAILPVPLPPGEALSIHDTLPSGEGAPLRAIPNHWPLYWFRPDGTVIRRVGEPSENNYQAQEELDHTSVELREVWT